MNTLINRYTPAQHAARVAGYKITCTRNVYNQDEFRVMDGSISLSDEPFGSYESAVKYLRLMQH